MKQISNVLMTAIVAAAVTPAHAALIAHYSFDSDFTDGSSAGRDLTEVGTSTAITTVAADVKFGSGAADFSADNDHLSMGGNTISFGSSDVWSVSFWAKIPTSAGSDQGMALGQASTAGNFIWVDNTKVRFRGGSTEDVTFNSRDNTYHHYAFVADGSGNLTTYIDNVATTQAASTNWLIDAVGQAYSNNAGFAMDGQIDELYVFDEALDSATVTSLYTSNTIPEPGSLILLALGGLCLLRRQRA